MENCKRINLKDLAFHEEDVNKIKIKLSLKCYLTMKPWCKRDKTDWNMIPYSFSKVTFIIFFYLKWESILRYSFTIIKGFFFYFKLSSKYLSSRLVPNSVMPSLLNILFLNSVQIFTFIVIKLNAAIKIFRKYLFWKYDLLYLLCV